MTNLPFALVGGALTLGSMVGFVTLFGITLRNSIVLISHYRQLVQHGGHAWNRDTATLGACERLAPILMTALALRFGRFDRARPIDVERSRLARNTPP